METKNKADPNYDWRPVIKKLAEEYRQVYGEEIDYDTVFEFIREKNEEKALVGYEEWDYAQAVTEALMGEEIPKQDEIPNPDDEDEDEPPKPKAKPKEEAKPKSKKKQRVLKEEQGHLEFSCNKGLLKNFCKKLLVADNEARINADEKGITCRLVDPSHVLMIDIFIPSSEFYTGYDCINKKINYKIDKPLEAGLDLEKLDTVLKLIEWGSDTVHVTMTDTEMFLETTSDKPLRKKITMLDTAGMMQSKKPELQYDLEAEVSRSELSVLQKATGAEGMSTEPVELNADKHLRAIIPDVDGDDLTLTLTKTVKGQGRSLYSCDYINKILSALTENRTVKLRWSVDSPIEITGKMQDKATYCYLLAPRIESE